MSSLDGPQQVFCRIIDAREHIRIAFCVCGPEHNDFVQSMLTFEVTAAALEVLSPMDLIKHSLPDVLADFLDVRHTSLGSF